MGPICVRAMRGKLDTGKRMKIDLISDLHGHFPKLEGGDLLIVAGDLTARPLAHELMQFGEWLNAQPYKKKVVIGGNHDNLLAGGRWHLCTPAEYGWDFIYLLDSGTEFQGLKIWGSPWTKRFDGMNPHCMAFTVDTEEELAKKWALIPDDTEILITHSPPKGYLDRLSDGTRVGSESLFDWWYSSKAKLKLWVCGHIHESYGRIDMNHYYSSGLLSIVNASHVEENYIPINKPIRIEL
jgi:Icc-related predicted phosphoesterase